MTKKITELTNEDPVTVSEAFLNYLAEIDTKEANKDGTLNQDLDKVLENEWHLTGEAKFRAKELFHQAVRNNSTRLQEGIIKLVGQYLPILESEKVVEILTAKIQALEAAISEVKEDSYRLACEQVSKLSAQFNLNEAVVTALWNNSADFDDLNSKLQQAAKSERPVRRSTVEYFLEELNEDPNWASGGAEPYIDPQMRAYMKALGHK